MVLLKSEGRSSKEIADIVGTNLVSVNTWVNRYQTEGMGGLKTRSGRGRKPILDEQADAEKVKAIVKKEQQRLKNAKEDLEEELGKKFSLKTLHRFLKNLSVNGNAYD
ncbi:MAG: helix-turn-helix domain-containing protein [Bacteroidota bacterium]